MEKVQIDAGHADKIEFTGEMIAEINWSLRNLAFSAHAKAYRTDTGRLVVSVDEWEDEKPEPQPHQIHYAIVELSSLETASRRGPLARFFKGDVQATLLQSIYKAFPSFNNRHAGDFAKILLDRLGYGPAVLRQV